MKKHGRQHHSHSAHHHSHHKPKHEHHGHVHEHISHEYQRHMSSYKHELDRPKEPSESHVNAREMGLHDFYKEADPIAYGQAGMQGCHSDDKKIQSQFKDYHWD